MPVHIGSKYTGKPAAHADTTTGIYWEALPRIDGNMLVIQGALLAKPTAPRLQLRARVNSSIDVALTNFTERRLKPRAILPNLVGMQK